MIDSLPRILHVLSHCSYNIMSINTSIVLVMKMNFSFSYSFDIMIKNINSSILQKQCTMSFLVLVLIK